jgi:hypothetical protein
VLAGHIEVFIDAELKRRRSERERNEAVVKPAAAKA